MERLSLLAFIYFIFIPFSDSFIEEKSLDEVVATLQLTVQGLQGRVRAMENQCECTAKSPVFMATLSNDYDSCRLHETVVFNSVKINQGSGYNNKNGRFRAPVAGVYAFSATLSVEPHNQYHVAFVKGGSANQLGYLLADPQNIWLQRSTTVFTHLNRNDEVWMMCMGDSRIEGDHQHIWEGASDYHSHMSGFLVSADRNSTLYP